MASTKVTGDLGLVTAYGAALAGGYTGSESDFYKSLAYLAQNGGIIHPVGSVYMSSEPTSPASLFGGTWERIKDTFILAAGDTYAAGSTGGSATHDHTVSGNASIGVIQNTTIYDSSGLNLTELSTNLYAYTHEYDSILSSDNEFYSKVTCIKTKGNANEQSNMPPYTTVYVWKRIA